MRRPLSTAVAALSLLLCASPVAALETFDQGPGGFTGANTHTTFSHLPSSCNPLGCVRAAGGPEQLGFSTVDARFTGDLSRLTGDGVVFVKFDFLGSQARHVWLRKSSAYNAWTFTVPGPPITNGSWDGQWRSHVVTIDVGWTDAQAQAAGWQPPSTAYASFKDTVASLWSISIMFGYSGPHSALLDNFDVVGRVPKKILPPSRPPVQPPPTGRPLPPGIAPPK